MGESGSRLASVSRDMQAAESLVGFPWMLIDNLAHFGDVGRSSHFLLVESDKVSFNLRQETLIHRNLRQGALVSDANSWTPLSIMSPIAMCEVLDLSAGYVRSALLCKSSCGWWWETHRNLH